MEYIVGGIYGTVLTMRNIIQVLLSNPDNMNK